MGAAFRFGWSGSRSRRRQAREQEPAACEGVRWATLPCPAGKEALPVCGVDAVCPCGAKALQSWRAWFWFVTGESRKSGRFAHQERLAGAPGDGVAANIQRGNGRNTGYSPFALTKSSVPPLPHALFLMPSRGETGGLCPHPLKGFIP